MSRAPGWPAVSIQLLHPVGPERGCQPPAEHRPARTSEACSHLPPGLPWLASQESPPVTDPRTPSMHAAGSAWCSPTQSPSNPLPAGTSLLSRHSLPGCKPARAPHVRSVQPFYLPGGTCYLLGQRTDTPKSLLSFTPLSHLCNRERCSQPRYPDRLRQACTRPPGGRADRRSL